MDPGQLLAGKYRIERVLGEGGMGRVCAALHETLGQRVAIKFLLPEMARRQDIVARFLREARAVVRLKSEHVGRVTDVGTTQHGAPYLVMEYLEGYDLAHRGGRATLPPHEAVDYVLQALEAIAEAHALGIIHRDLKPANLFVTRQADGSALVKVLDFGIAKAAATDNQDMTSTQAVMGSPDYMSPEQFKSTRDVNVRADIWSMGIVLFELLSGIPPFHGETFPDTCVKVVSAPTPAIDDPNVPPGLQVVLARCLEKNREHRFSNVAELAAALVPFGQPNATMRAARIARVLSVSVPDLATLLGPTPASAPITTLASATGQSQSPLHQQSSPSRRGLWIGLAAAGAAAAIAAAVVLSGGGDDRAETAVSTVDEPAETMPATSAPSSPAPAKTPAPETPTPKAAPKPPADATRLASGLAYVDRAAGFGKVAKAGDNVVLRWTITGDDGKRAPASPLTELRLAAPAAIAGLVEGVPGMKPGSKRTMWVPAGLTNGGEPVAAAGREVMIDVELVAVKAAEKPASPRRKKRPKKKPKPKEIGGGFID